MKDCIHDDLHGLKPDPFEGSQWDGLGFFVQYLWLISGGIAAGTYNEESKRKVQLEPMES
ncbi:unnamed protein product [Brassica napus]|uniref:(rape) hypothetical protein n=1 Tax=Brassica napus TaxID=3708 RepID=A0A816TTN2_BRANA|nr:unnamed protein product [Brassica napus]